jgi:hypothetical protein
MYGQAVDLHATLMHLHHSINSVSSEISKARDQLDELANGVVTEVLAMHSFISALLRNVITLELLKH